MAETAFTTVSKAFSELTLEEKNFRVVALMQAIAQAFSGLGTGWAAPTGTAIFTSFNANATTAVSNPPTQAEVQAINDRLLETRQILKGLINTLIV